MLNKYKNIFKYFKYIRKYKIKFYIGLFFMLISSVVSAFIPKFIQKLIDIITTGYNTKLISIVTISFIGAIFLQQGSKYISEYIFIIIGKKTTFTLKYKILSHLLKLDGDYYCNFKVGEILNVLDGDTCVVEEIATQTICSIISDLLTAVLIFTILINIQYRLLAIIILIQFITVVVEINFNKKTIKYKRKMRNAIGQVSDIEQEVLNNISNVVVLNAKGSVFSNFIKKQKIFIKELLKLDRCFLLNFTLLNLLNRLSTIIILVYGGYKVKLGTISIGELISFNIYVEKMFSPIINIIKSNMKIQQSIIAINNIFKILDEPIKIKKEKSSLVGTKRINGCIEFKSVEFSYVDNNKTLDNVNLQFKPNTISSIVGFSGSGKSTLTKLLFRLWDVKDGKILLDGIDIRTYKLNFLRKNLSIVSQDVFLFNDTILSNLTLGLKNVSLEYVVNICKKAEIHDFIMSLPKQYNTIVGNSSIKLSGGQKQRIALARAIIKDTPILILDEFTSALDNELQHKIFKNIEDYLRSKTTILITHKLLLTEESNIIYVMDKGKLTESGTYSELLSRKNIYYKLHNKEGL